MEQEKPPDKEQKKGPHHNWLDLAIKILTIIKLLLSVGNDISSS